MENGEVISFKQGSIIELPKGWLKEYAPFEFFDGLDATKGDYILIEAWFKRTEDRLETIIKSVIRVDKKLTRLNAGFRRKASENLVFFLLDIVKKDLEKTMDLLDVAKECFFNAENNPDLKIKKHYIASGSWKLTCTKKLLDAIERDFGDGKHRFDSSWISFAEAGVAPSKTRDGLEDAKRLLSDISSKIKTIRDDVRRLEEKSIEQL